jgi:hypothetical protein
MHPRYLLLSSIYPCITVYDQPGIVDAKRLQKDTGYVSLFYFVKNGTLLNLYKLRNFMLYIIISLAAISFQLGNVVGVPEIG